MNPISVPVEYLEGEGGGSIRSGTGDSSLLYLAANSYQTDRKRLQGWKCARVDEMLTQACMSSCTNNNATSNSKSTRVCLDRELLVRMRSKLCVGIRREV